jgi:ABC-2 type transport system ATP-binding protein
MTMTEVAVRQLTKRFGAATAVRDLTVDVSPGVTGFLGPNGAGKSTTFRMVVGLVRPTSGTAVIAGRRYAELRHPRRVVGAVLESTGFHPGRTARDHLRIAARLNDIPRSRVDVVLDEVGLAAAADRRIGGYSLGMRQRLGLAVALLGDPEVLLMDEPGNGLDPAGLAWLRGLLRDLAGQGRTVIVSSHVLAEVAQTVDRVVIMHGGVMRFAGSLDELSEPGFPALEAAFLRLTGGQISDGIRP